MKRKRMDKGLEFSRPDFVRDILFSKEGFNLKPVVFTKSTAKLKDSEKIASTSTKDHLPYFDDNEFVAKYIEWAKISKLQNTYVGVEYDEKAKGPTGFWQYIYEGKIHPSYLLHRTVTGRTASANPNGQNIPKHGKLAKAYRKIFVPTPGYTFIECDLSQAELRLVAWMANEPTMLGIYRAGGDIHAATAAMVMGISLTQFMALDKDVKRKKRQEAKAIQKSFLQALSRATPCIRILLLCGQNAEGERQRNRQFASRRYLWHVGFMLLLQRQRDV